jgi:hypothetical protein
LANVLAQHSEQIAKSVPAGLDATAARDWKLTKAAAEAERIMGGMEGGAVRYPGQEEIEGALAFMNRYGLAPFTAYPVHTMHRLFQLLQNKPSILLRYPQLRSYLYAADEEYGTGQAGERYREHQVGYLELPLPFGKRGTVPPYYRAGHIIPGEEAAEGLDIGGLIRTLPHGPLGTAVDYAFQSQGYDRRSGRLIEGLNPDTLQAQSMHRALQSLLPSTFASGAERLERSVREMPPFAGTTRPEPAWMPALALAGFDTHYPEATFERKAGGDIPTPKLERVQFMQQALDEVDQHPERLRDYSPWLKGKDAGSLARLHSDSQRELQRLLSDGHIDEGEARRQIRFQAHFLKNIINRQTAGPHFFDAGVPAAAPAQ